MPGSTEMGVSEVRKGRKGPLQSFTLRACGLRKSSVHCYRTCLACKGGSVLVITYAEEPAGPASRPERSKTILHSAAYVAEMASPRESDIHPERRRPEVTVGCRNRKLEEV